MFTVRDYVGISPETARQQWRGVVARSMPTQGQRQVAFVPVETLLALAASLLVNHRRYGGSTAHLAEEPVPTLARLFRRPNSSVLAKMANLDGSRRHGAKHEVEVAARLLAGPGELGRVYRIVMAAARDEGIDASDHPDFLTLVDDQEDLHLLGQDELANVDLETDVEGASAQWLNERHDLDERITQRLLVAVVRVGQHRFASEVLRNHQHRCVFCGLAVRTHGVRAQRMLVASHIKPWRVSSAAERLDARNGLTACPTHDVAFDIGLLTVNGGLQIHILPSLDHSTHSDPAARAAFGRPPLAQPLLLPNGAPHPKTEYLSWHHHNVFLDPALIGAGPT